MSAAAPSHAPVGVVLAGGLGRRLGGDKAVVELEGVPLVRYALAALHDVCDDVAVVAKRDTVLPSLAGTAQLWVEPAEPRHPLVGIAHALRLAGGRPVLALAVDLPLVDEATLRCVLEAGAPGAAAVVPRVYGRLEPLCALYRPAALEALMAAARTGAAATAAVQALEPCVVEPPTPEAFLNVNRPEDILQAAVLLRARLSPR